MILSCPSCPKTYDVPSSAIPPGGREVACSACGSVWFERGWVARAAASGAAGADLVIEAEYADVHVDQHDRPRPTEAPAEARAAPSPAREQQTALAVAYEADPQAEETDDTAEAVRVLIREAMRSLKAARDGALGALGFLLGTASHLLAAARPRPVRKALTSGDAAARETRARMRAREVNRMTPGRLVGWLAWTGTLAGLLYGVTMQGERVRTAFPPAVRLYERAVPSPVAPDLSVDARLEAFSRSSEGPAVVVSGRVANEGAAPAFPRLTMTTLTPDGSQEQAVPLSRVALPAGGERPFAVRALVPPGTTAVRLAVRPGEAPSAEGLTMHQRGGAWGSPGGHAGPPRLGGAPHGSPR